MSESGLVLCYVSCWVVTCVMFCMLHYVVW